MHFKKIVLFMILTLVRPAFSAPMGGLTPAPSPTASSLTEEKKRLEVERLELENEKLKFELDKLKSKTQDQAAPTQVPVEKKSSKEDLEAYQISVSNKAEALAKENKDKEDILVPDFVNSEIWNHGVRYNLHELYALAQDMKWPMKKSLKGRDSHGFARNLYRIRNISLLRYEGRDRGVVEIIPSSQEGDFRVLTPEGITLDSSVGDVRNSYQNIFLTYDGQVEEGKFRVLKYKHSRGLNLSDRLEFYFDPGGKLAKIRYGVLEEH